MAAGGDDRLSQLPDDLLRRVLHFAPLKEAASTTALSRRWRAPLWLSSGAVNLETGVSCRYDYNSRFFSRRDAFVSAAVGALDAADIPVTRLTLRLESDLQEPVDNFLSWYRDRGNAVSHYTNLVDVVLSHRAARRVEELRLVAKDPNDYYHCGDRVGAGLYTVTLDSLPSETLRVLELTSCKGLYQRDVAAAALVLPRLSSIRLSYGAQHLTSLQRFIDAAPALAAVRLDSVRILIDATDTTRRLRCPMATVLVLDSCTWEEKNQAKKTVVDGVEIDAPRLCRFRYKGLPRPFSFSPQPLELEQVDLDFSGRGDLADRDLATLWRFARSFTSTKEMRLRVNHLEDIAVLSEARRVDLLPSFRRLQRLEVQGAHGTKGKIAAVTTILNLLRCCPVLRALRINLTAAAEHHDASNGKGVRSTRIPRKEIQIAGLLGSRHLFPCLQSSLTRVDLRFGLAKSDCLGVKLIKFFAENAMVLEEMHIDGGDENLCEHMKPKTEKWISKRRKLGATSFVVLPLN